MNSSLWHAERRPQGYLDEQYLLVIARMLQRRAEERGNLFNPLKERFKLPYYRFYTGRGRGWTKPAGNVRNGRYAPIKLTKKGLNAVTLVRLQGQ